MEQREVARDVVRGLNALEMSFVNIANLEWSNHSGYIDQIKYADTIFPFFAFVSGMSRVPTRRSIGLVGLGLGLSAVSAYSKGDSFRVPGVLQRLGLASLLANAPALSGLRQYHGLPLIAIWYALSLTLGGMDNPFAHHDYPQADPLRTAQTKIDLALFGDHIYTPTHDPEGLLGSLTTALSMLIGRDFARASRHGTDVKAIVGLVMIGLGEGLHAYAPKYCPLSKGLWTPSFVLVSSGYSILKYLAAQHFTPFLPRFVQYTLACVGQRSLEIYVLSSLSEMALLHGGQSSLWNKALSFSAKYSSRSIADFCLSSAFALVMAALAIAMVRASIQLRW